MPPRPLSRRRFLLTATSGLCAAGCASLSPFPRTTGGRVDEDASLEVIPVEGQPNGPVLKLTSATAPPDNARIALFRKNPDGSSDELQTTELSAHTAKQLAKDGLRFVDRSIDAAGHYAYRLRLTTPNDTVSWSSPVSVEWRQPPPEPESLQCRPVDGRLVEIAWAPENAGALIFKKNVMGDATGFERLGLWRPDAAGLAADRQVTRGDVYAYRLALAIRTPTFTQFGPASAPVYVSV